MRSQDEYGEPEVYEYPGWTITVYHPIITEEERARRMKAIERSAANLLMDFYEKERMKKINV